MSLPSSERRRGLAAAIWMYTIVRVAMVALATGLLALAGVPLLIALLVGLIVALPLSMVLFRGLRARLDEALAQTRERRAVERAALRSRLRGDAASEADVVAGGGGARPPAVTDVVGASDERTADQHAQAQPDRREH